MNVRDNKKAILENSENMDEFKSDWIKWEKTVENLEEHRFYKLRDHASILIIPIGTKSNSPQNV